MQDKGEANKEHEKQREERDKRWREDSNTKVHTNKAFEKIERFDGSNPEWCLPWMEEMFVMTDNHTRNPREELLFNSGGSVQKILYFISPEATPDQIKDILLHNHSNLKTPSQCMSPHPLWRDDGWEAGGVLMPWESAVGALPSFLGVDLEEPPQLLSPRCCWACPLRLRRTSGRQAWGTLSCGYARLRKIQRPASGTSHICSWHCNALWWCDCHFPPHKCRRGRTRASPIYLEDWLGGVIGMRWCAAPWAWRQPLLSQHCAPGSCRASQWHGLTLADLGSACGLRVPEVRGTLVGHLSSPGCRTGTGHRCQTRYHQRPGTCPCSPRAAPPSLDDWVVPYHTRIGHRSWCL